MRNPCLAVALVLAVLAAGPAAAAGEAPDPAAFHETVISAYTFRRADLKGEGIAAQSAKLDAFWKAVTADKEHLLPLLRAELGRSDVPEFFHFDGAELLIAMSQTPEDMALGLRSVALVDPDNVMPGGYLIALNKYSARGLDTRPMAWHWLAWKEPEIPVSMAFHVFWPSPLEALVWSLYGTDEHAIAADLIQRLAAAKADGEISLLIEALWTTATPEGHAALDAYAADKTRKRKARDFAAKMLAHGPDAPDFGDTIPLVGGLRKDPKTEPELRAARLAVLHDPWRHGAFAEYHRLTDQLVAAAGLQRK